MTQARADPEQANNVSIDRVMFLHRDEDKNGREHWLLFRHPGDDLRCFDPLATHHDIHKLEMIDDMYVVAAYFLGQEFFTSLRCENLVATAAGRKERVHLPVLFHPPTSSRNTTTLIIPSGVFPTRYCSTGQGISSVRFFQLIDIGGAPERRLQISHIMHVDWSRLDVAPSRNQEPVALGALEIGPRRFLGCSDDAVTLVRRTQIDLHGLNVIITPAEVQTFRSIIFREMMLLPKKQMTEGEKEPLIDIEILSPAVAMEPSSDPVPVLLPHRSARHK
ncbi:hypothetical protein C8J57DRAFT_1242276 [Mycena rebaudengoi]|nr:hypothetical protein C8J57DRAFT_1242276 [Mycena rebaudengoi]